MIGTVVKKEIVSNLLSYKFFIVILLLTLLLFTSVFVLTRDLISVSRRFHSPG